MRVAFVHNLLIHYRVPLFNLLDGSPDFKFDFYFGAIHPWMQAASSAEKQYRPRFRFVLLKGLRLPDYNYLSLSLLFWLTNRYDAYLACSLTNPDCWITFLMAKLFRKPFILWEERWEPPRSILLRLLRAIHVLIARKADLIIVPGSRSLSYFAKMLGDDSRLVLAPNASTLEKPSEARVRDFRKKYEIPSHCKVVLYLGRLMARKGVRVLLESFARLESEFQDRVFLLIAGEGDDRESLQSLSRQLHIGNVKFSGFVDDQAACIAASDILILPSISSGATSEVWGLIINEAVSLGKPVVTTNTVGCAYDIVERFQCGYVVDERDSDALYRAIRNIIAEPETAAALSANGIVATNTTFNFEKMAQSFVCAIQRISSEHE
jgi:glycosyltransferase involved in cell wall biosynthesis